MLKAKELAAEIEIWLDHPSHSTRLSIEEHAIIEITVLVRTPEDDDGVGVELEKDGDTSRSEACDFDELPFFCPQPEHLHRARFSVSGTLPTGNVELFAECRRRVLRAREI